MIGRNPIWLILRVWGAIYGIIIFIIVLTCLTGEAAYIFGAFALGLPIMFMALFPFAKQFGTALGGYLASYKRARKAVQEGVIDPDWGMRGATCIGIALVDERNRRIYINGELFDFDDVKSIGWKSFPDGNTMNHVIDFYLKSGSHPALRVYMDNENSMRVAYARLSNTFNL